MNQLKPLQENRIYFLMIPHHMHIGSLFLKVYMFSHWKIYFLKRLSYLFEKLQFRGLHAAGPFIESTCSSCSLKGEATVREWFSWNITSSPKENLCMNFNWEQASRSATWRLIEIQSATVPRKRIFQYLNNRTYWKTWRLIEIQSVMVYHWKSISPNPRSHSNIENIK